jgi:membrane associated rhomboid family serine protease
MSHDVQGTAGAAVPTCHRHPERETYVRCIRCERPICPDCMVTAAVGFQCPECVRAGNRTVRQPRTVAGGRLTAPGVVTMAIIAINVVLFLLVQVIGAPLVDRLVLVDRTVVDGQWAGVAAGEYYRLLTATFLHVTWWHILTNMVALWFVGPVLEQVLGRLRFVALYLISALTASAVSYAFSPPGSASLGASGAVMGLFGALLVIGRRQRYDVSPLAFSLLVTLALPLFIPAVDWRAHLGGLVAGVILGVAFAYAPAPRGRTVVHLAVCMGVTAMAVLLVVVHTVALTG